MHSHSFTFIIVRIYSKILSCLSTGSQKWQRQSLAGAERQRKWPLDWLVSSFPNCCGCCCFSSFFFVFGQTSAATIMTERRCRQSTTDYVDKVDNGQRQQAGQLYDQLQLHLHLRCLTETGTYFRPLYSWWFHFNSQIFPSLYNAFLGKASTV